MVAELTHRGAQYLRDRKILQFKKRNMSLNLEKTSEVMQAVDLCKMWLGKNYKKDFLQRASMLALQALY